ncbi:hypothetical protein D3272_03355 [Lichenibacterium ramalinae]|uniref:Uncharacterized protein n=2 Tax=Lichenibacterium ramalinae TaxID=2316527 RepID=A0A4Q2RJI0_9HYPH|nr:hypothetical protein D3272_03355 [Lichenibacterium ramalinae]
MSDGTQAMKAAAASFAICTGLGLAMAAASPPPRPAPVVAKPAAPGCEAFMKDFPPAAPGYRISFERPLTIARGFGDMMSGIDVRILSSDTKVDGTLKCRDDTFLRFELRATLPADAKILADLDKFERAALMAAFHWDRPKAETIEKAMTADAGEYLRASIERGDLYNSGKVEYHQADQLDLGLIWTQTDHTFVISAQSDD